MSIIITGAAGFIGSNLVHRLNAEGRTDLILVDDLTDGRKCANLGGAQYEEFVPSRDLTRLLVKTNESHGASVIVHLGANTNTCETNGEKLRQENFEVTRELLAAAVAANIRVVYASSAAVYGTPRWWGTSSFAEEPINENPTNAYGFSKLMVDQHVRRYYADQPVVGLRFFNVYGPREQHKNDMASFIHKVLWDNYLRRKNGRTTDIYYIKLFKDSRNILRDFVFVDDVINVILHAMSPAAAMPGGIYNVGSGWSFSFYEVATALRDFIVKQDMQAFISEPLRPPFTGYQHYTRANLDKLCNTKCRIPSTSLGSGIQAVWDSFQYV
jgi:ADP-L-glycero-D-manno-heptose 6-epimerase